MKPYLKYGYAYHITQNSANLCPSLAIFEEALIILIIMFYAASLLPFIHLCNYSTSLSFYSTCVFDTCCCMSCHVAVYVVVLWYIAQSVCFPKFLY